MKAKSITAVVFALFAMFAVSCNCGNKKQKCADTCTKAAVEEVIADEEVIIEDDAEVVIVEEEMVEE